MSHATDELTPAEVAAIVALLGDGDERTSTAIAAQLLERPRASRLAVVEAAEAAGVWVAMHLPRVLRLNRREALASRFAMLARDEQGEVDLEAAVLLVAEIGMADVDAAAVSRRLDVWAHDVALATAPPGGPDAQLQALRTVLFGRQRFRGEHDTYYEPQNSLLPRVMETRVGLPLTLSVIVLLVARRLAMPLVGIAAPRHFLLRHTSASGPVYVDAFDGGTLMTETECLQFLELEGAPAAVAALPVAGPALITARMLRNLAIAYQRKADIESALDCRACLDALNSHNNVHLQASNRAI